MTRETDDLTGAIGDLEAELAGHPSPRAFAPLAEAYRLTGRLEDALRTARAGADAHPKHVGIRMVLARSLADSGDLESARGAYERVLELDPANLEAQAFIMEVGETQRADATPEPRPREGAADGPAGLDRPVAGTLSEELAHLADLFVPSGRPNGQESTGDGPTGIATLTLAEIYSRQGLNAEAAEVCERILERDPENEEARLKLEQYKHHAAAA